mgnify:CR=1 FL=1
MMSVIHYILLRFFGATGKNGIKLVHAVKTCQLENVKSLPKKDISAKYRILVYSSTTNKMD